MKKSIFKLLLCFVVQIQIVCAQEQEVPLGGNSWATKNSATVTIGNDGWKNWTNSETILSVYIFVKKPGSLTLSSAVQLSSGRSRFRCSVGKKSTVVSVKQGERKYALGTYSVSDSGYVKIDLQGIDRTGAEFGQLKSLFISGTAVDEHTAFVKNNADNYFYWGRRGPSVHLGYDLPFIGEEAEYFYNELIVPKGNDVIGSYFMANGFAEGYFGMQVNSEVERRILFSIWSPFVTDNPASIPSDQKIVLLKKGKDVYTGEFGNEGSGGQSYLKYNWRAGDTCRFLLRAAPAENNYTHYTAWFFDNNEARWRLIARFSRPYTKTYLKRLHSFLENFIPSTGFITRKAYYRNQWVRTVSGSWKPIERARFTGDATAQKSFRLDYKGGVEQGAFFLQNGGFFSDRTPLRSFFQLIPQGQRPFIDTGLLEGNEHD